MSLENEIRSNTVAIDALTQSVDALIALLSEQVMAPGGAPTETPAVTHSVEEEPQIEAPKEPKKDKVKSVDPKKELESGITEQDEPETSSPEPIHTQKELRELLNEYKERFGIALAKKLLPKMTNNKYKTSSDVPNNEVDELYSGIEELLSEDAL